MEKSIRRLIITESGLVVERESGLQLTATVSAESRLYSTLIILKLVPSDSTNKPTTVVLWPHRKRVGNVEPDLHRRLKTWLRLGASDDSLHQSHQ